MFSTKKLFILGFLLFTTVGVSFGNFEDGFYCSIKGQSIKISLNKNDGGKCTEYIKYLEQKMKGVYMDILTIQGYIKKKQDAGYRIPIQDQKTKLLNDLQKRRLSILINMRTFENNLLAKSKELFLTRIQAQKQKLEDVLVQMQTLSGSSNQGGIDRYIQLTQNVLNAIKGIENCKTFTRFDAEIKAYLYSTKQLEGK